MKAITKVDGQKYSHLRMDICFRDGGMHFVLSPITIEQKAGYIVETYDGGGVKFLLKPMKRSNSRTEAKVAKLIKPSLKKIVDLFIDGNFAGIDSILQRKVCRWL